VEGVGVDLFVLYLYLEHGVNDGVFIPFSFNIAIHVRCCEGVGVDLQKHVNTVPRSPF